MYSKLDKNKNINYIIINYYYILFFRVQNAPNIGGMIHYVPDEADDWDEEDPDDDLEI